MYSQFMMRGQKNIKH